MARFISAAGTEIFTRWILPRAICIGNLKPVMSYVRPRSQTALFFGSWDSYFYAVDATIGKEKRRFHAGEDPVIHNQVGFHSSPAVADGKVFFAHIRFQFVSRG